jgi:hypothetical protein
MSVPRYLRRFFVYACAFAGAAWFGDTCYTLVAAGQKWPTEFTLLILASLAVAAVVAALAERD